MRYALTVVGVLILATACGGHSSPGTSTGATGTGTGGAATTGGTSGGMTKLPAGGTCSSDTSCKSGFCGIDAVDGGVNVDGGSNCCEAECATSDALCGALGCDNSGACIYPAAGITCAPSTCSGDLLTLNQCDGFGNCFINPAVPCTGHYVCSSNRTDCDTSCKIMADCASGYYCETDAGTCIAQIATGACTSNIACTSNVCGLDGTGNCCTTACTNTAAPCGATNCDATSGACVFPATTVLCGPGGATSCASDVETNPDVFCDGNGYCPSQMIACAPFACAATACFTSCTDDTSCVSGTAYCNQDAGVCLNKVDHGPCLLDDACLTGICGIAGVGNCCDQVCTNTAPPCGATDCDPSFGSCSFPGGSTTCGSIPESCSAGIQQNPSACDGDGGCDNSPGTTACTPFICGTNACFVSCTDATSCVSGDFCDTANSTCCTPIASGGTITVDGAIGSDATICCGYGGAGNCQTVSHAMALIDGSSAKNVTINASLQGFGGNWGLGETYPIVLGWGAELNAPGVYFFDRTGGNKESIDIAQYSSNDTVGYASIVGGGSNDVGIGMSSSHNLQTTDQAAVRIENGQTLYIANALLNGSALGTSAALFVEAGGALVLGEDQPDLITGTVTIGNDANNLFTDGWDGIYCNTATSTGCTITDATLTGQSSVVIQGQEDSDITALDFASISLTSAPMIGVPPTDTGFGECPPSSAITPGSSRGKPDVAQSKGQAIWLDGKVTMTFNNGTVQCISGTAFELVTSPNGNGNPSLTLQNTTVQNTERAVYASAGTATISGSTIQFNYNGVEQTSDGTNTGTINLSGTDGGANTVVCSSGIESITAVDGGTTATPGVNVLNDTTATLDAADVAWDTSGPDLFSCKATLLTCTCENSSCSNAGGVDDMDAVYDSTGTITTTGATVSPIATSSGCN